jgi:hypothetical protein
MMKPHLRRTIGSGIALVFLMGAGVDAAHPNAVAFVMLGVPGKGIVRAPQVAPVPATAMSTFQLSINRKDYPATLPVSSVATYVLAPGSSTLAPTEATTSGSALALKLSQPAAISPSAANPSLPQIAVDPSTTYQEIAGFGGAITDTSLAHFSIAHEAANTIPLLQAVKKKLNPGLKLIARPWSAPGWRKILGQFLSPCSDDYLGSYRLDEQCVLQLCRPWIFLE